MKLSKTKIAAGLAALVLVVAFFYFLQNLSPLNLAILVAIGAVGPCGYMLARMQQFEERLAVKDRIIEGLQADKAKLQQFMAEQILKETRVDPVPSVLVSTEPAYEPRPVARSRFPWQIRFDRRNRDINEIGEKPAIEQGEVG